MGALFRRLLSLYPGEGKLAALFGGLAFLSAVAISGCVTIADGMFLEHVGADGLSIVYLITACGMFLYTGVLLLKLNRSNVRHSLLWILLLAAALYGFIALTLPWGGWTWICAVSDMVFLMGLTGIWNFIDQSYDLQDAKRHYGFFTASFILGSGAGAALVSLTIDTVGPSGVFALLSGCFLVAGSVAYYLIRTTTPLPVTPSEEKGEKGSLKAILTSPFTLLLLVFCVLLGLGQFLMEFTYMEALEGVFAGEDGNALTRFLGISRGWIYVCDMVFGAFIYGRLIRKMGINNASLIPAGYFFLVFLTSPLLEGLLMAILGLIAVEGILSTVYDSNLHLLLNAAPAQIKTKLRVCCENLLEPLGMLLCSLLLLFFEPQARMIGVALTGVAVIVALLMRSSYRKAIFRRLRDNADHLRGAPQSIQRCDAEELWERIAQDGSSDLNSDDLIERARAIIAHHGPKEMQSLQRLLTSDAIENVRVGITVTGLLGSPHHFDSVLPYAHDASEEVQQSCMHALSKLSNPSARHHVRRLLGLLATVEMPSTRRHLLTTLEPLCDARHVRELLLLSKRSEWRQVEVLIIRIGPQAVAPLIALLASENAPLDARLLACTILGRLQKQPKELYTLISNEIDAAYSYFFHMNVLEEKELAIRLHRSFWTAIDLVIHMLGLAGLIEDCDLLCQALRSSNEKIHSHAVESLEKSCDAKLFRKLVVLVDDRPLRDKVRSASQRSRPLTDFSERLLHERTQL